MKQSKSKMKEKWMSLARIIITTTFTFSFADASGISILSITLALSRLIWVKFLLDVTDHNENEFLENIFSKIFGSNKNWCVHPRRHEFILKVKRVWS